MKKLLVSLMVVSALFAEATKEEQLAKKIALEASMQYQKDLQNAMEKVLYSKGPAAAIQFCSKHAYPITMRTTLKLRRKLGVKLKLKRISFKYRDSADAPNVLNVEPLKELQRQDPRHPQVVMRVYPNRIDVYEPIYVQKVCLKCHGSNLSGEVKKALSKYYENDKARGYHVGDFRGAVVVTIERRSLQKLIKKQSQTDTNAQ